MANPPLLRLSLLTLLMLCLPLSYAFSEDLEIECENAITQTDMNICAAREALKAAETLNTAYEAATAFANNADEGAENALISDTLLKAQDAWVVYRDMSCEAEAALYDGGSIQPMIYASCLERLNLSRSEELNMIYKNL